MKKVESRYSALSDSSRKEEIVLLQGRGCFWKRCAFCDYYLDTASESEIIAENSATLKQVTGEMGRLTVLNSGSFFELPEKTQSEIIKLLHEKGINDLTVEAHWVYRDKIRDLKKRLHGFGVRLSARIGIETFDIPFREGVLKKGMGSPTPEEIARYFDECCLLFGIQGQTLESLEKDIALACRHFRDVYLNIYEEIEGLKADDKLIERFKRELLAKLSLYKNLHVLINNTDLGVG